jgi:hypothetical protein
VRRRIDIEPHDVLQLVGELRIIQEFELPDAVRLETVSPPNALHRTDAECLPFSPSWRRSSASLRREGWRVGQCQSDDAFGDVIVERLDARPHRRGERGAALQARYRFEKLHDLVGAERNWQLAWFPSIGNALRDERLAERDAVEEPQRADDLVQRRPRDAGRDEMHLEGAQAPTGAATCRNTG